VIAKLFFLSDLDGLEIVQPDNHYFGGMIRSMQVARMPQAFGKACTPHMSGGGLGFLYMPHFVSVLPNACPHHEFKGLRTNVSFHCPTSLSLSVQLPAPQLTAVLLSSQE
jgi:L-alanine-DL-glutamate epimerase-like enolase superfamily enzyme